MRDKGHGQKIRDCPGRFRTVGRYKQERGGRGKGEGGGGGGGGELECRSYLTISFKPLIESDDVVVM